MRQERGVEMWYTKLTGGGKFSKLKKRSINPRKLREIASESRRQEINQNKKRVIGPVRLLIGWKVVRIGNLSPIPGTHSGGSGGTPRCVYMTSVCT